MRGTNSFWHPLLHVFICLVLSCLAFMGSEPVKLSMLWFSSFIYAAFRVKAGATGLVKTHWRSLPLLLSLALVQLLFRRQGDLLWQFGIISLSREGANYLAVLSLRLLIVILSAKALAVLDFKEFSTAFHSLRLPEEFSFMLSYAVHLVPSLLSSWKGYFQSLKLRGIAINKLSIPNRLKIYKVLALSSLAALIKNSEGQAIALELRGFRSSGERSSMHERRFSFFDWVAIFMIFLAAALYLWL